MDFLSNAEIYQRITKFIDKSNNIELIKNIAVEVIDNKEHETSYYAWEEQICKQLGLETENELILKEKK